MSSRGVKTLLITLAMLAGVIVGLLAGILSHLAGNPLPIAIRDGGSAFGVAVTLIVLIMGAVGLL